MRFLLLLTLPLTAQDLYESGAKVFKLGCAQGYCHGSGGTQGRAPKLIGRTYDAAAAQKIIEAGVAGTGMPAFRERLSPEQLTAVTFYVVKVSGGDTSKVAAVSGSTARKMPGDAAAGKAAFFDAYLGVDRCSTCHAIEDMGIAVGPNLATGGPYDAAAIRNGKPATVRLASARGDTFPALVAEQKGDVVRVYDLTVAPPVLRTFGKGEIAFANGSQWKHAQATRSYNDGDLQTVAAYIKWVAER